MCNRKFNPDKSRYDLYCSTWCNQNDVPILYIGYAVELCRLIKLHPNVPRYKLLEAMYEEFSEPPQILDYTDDEIIDGMAMELSNIWSETYTINWKIYLPSLRDYMKEYKSASQSLFLKCLREVVDKYSVPECWCEFDDEDYDHCIWYCGCEDKRPAPNISWSDGLWI